MKLNLAFDIPKSNFNLSHSDSIVLSGSCFSDNIGGKLKHYGFNTNSNSFGTLFHPNAIANVIKSSIVDSTNVDSHERDGLFFSWDSSSVLYASSKVELEDNILKIRKSFKSNIEKASVLIITFGTAIGYKHTSLGYTVGNCHKANAGIFEKELTSLDSLVESWQRLIVDLKELNPKLKIVFTVSPVRHVKDGLVENNRSKARLLELVHQLVNGIDVIYFPSYEIQIDELRDYRFYNEDLIHPNSTAVDYIWERFSDFIFDDSTYSLNDKIHKLRLEESHRSLFPDSKAEEERKGKFDLKLKEFLTQHPEIFWK